MKIIGISILSLFFVACGAGEELEDVTQSPEGLSGKADEVGCIPAEVIPVDAGIASDAMDIDMDIDDNDATTGEEMEADSGDTSTSDSVEETEEIIVDEEVVEVEESEPETPQLPICGSPQDPYAQAYDVDAHLITFPEGTASLTYKAASVTGAFRLGGTEFWQKWSGGLSPTFSYYAGTEFGKRCMFASARRFEAIMNQAPEALTTLYNESKWSGSFFNWNDDYSMSTWGDGSSARLWAWRTTLVKWISQTNLDGSCYLPTMAQVEALAATCLSRAETSDGEIQGCSAQ